MRTAGYAAAIRFLLPCVLLAAGCDRDHPLAPQDPRASEAALQRAADPTVAGAPVGSALDHAAPEPVRQSDLPLLLVGTIVRDEPGKSMAAIRVDGAFVARNFRPGQEVLGDTVLERVERQRVYLRRGGHLEYLPLATAPATTIPVPNTPPRTMPPPNRVADLRRTDIDRALSTIPDLERQLTRGTPEVEGARLLIVAKVDPGSLYDLLGLQARDVLMQVDGEWIHDQRNPLWEALRQRERVRLLIIRGGFPQTFEYVIQ